MASPLSIQAVMPPYATAIFEGAQGILLDEWRGFHPHTTWSTVTLEPALAMIEESGAEKSATWALPAPTRHATERDRCRQSPDLDAILTDPGNPINDWQGTIRRGWLDFVLLRYAAEVSAEIFMDKCSMVWMSLPEFRRKYAQVIGSKTVISLSGCPWHPHLH